MIGYWISFALILFLAPIGLASIAVWRERKHSFSKAQKKNVRIRVVKRSLFYWLCDFFYMACFIDSLICKFSFGIAIITFALIGLARSFNSSQSKDVFEQFDMIQDFLIGIGLTIYLIYIIPTPSLQTIVTAIVASVYGGCITLAGVAWTIQRSDRNRKDDEIKKAKPLFSFNPQRKEIRTDGMTKTCYSLQSGAFGCHCEMCAEIENSDRSLFRFNKVYHDGQWYSLEGNRIVLPSEKRDFAFAFSDKSNIVLSVSDSFENEYLYLLDTVLVGVVNGSAGANRFVHSQKSLCTLRNIEEISEEQFHNLASGVKSKEIGKDGTK